MKTIIIGSGLSGLVAAGYLAKAGHTVAVLEQNTTIEGGIANVMAGARKVVKMILKA